MIIMMIMMMIGTVMRKRRMMMVMKVRMTIKVTLATMTAVSSRIYIRYNSIYTLLWTPKKAEAATVARIEQQPASCVLLQRALV